MTGPDSQHDDFLRQFVANEPQVRAFVRACLPDAADVDEVMQETSLVAWKKFVDRPEPDSAFGAWLCLIAKYEILMHRRRHARDRLVLDEDVIELLAEEASDEVSRREAHLRTLDACLEELPRERRELLRAAYAPGAMIKDLAVQVGRTEAALYQLLARLRRTLLECVERRLPEGESVS